MGRGRIERGEAFGFGVMVGMGVMSVLGERDE